MFCSNCGKEINTENKFCSFCGNKNKYFTNNNKIDTKSSKLDIENNLVKAQDSIKIISENNDEQLMGANQKNKVEEVNHKKISKSAHDKKSILSYFVKHWRGELSLGVSYWINNVLISTIIIGIITMTVEYIDFTNNPVMPSILIILMWVTIILLTPWILVGLWKSASNHISQYNKYFWPIIVKILAIIGWVQFVVISYQAGIPQIIEFSKIVLGKDSIPKYNISILNDGKELEISGGIRFGLTNEIEKYFIKYPNIKVLHLNSIGGRISESHKLYNFLKDKKLTTYTSLGCSSACVNVFLAGEYRFVSKNAYLGFHQPGFAGMSESDLYDTIRKEKNFYLDKNINADFVNKIFSTPNDDIWQPSHFELLNAGMIDKVVDGYKFSSTDLTIWSDIKKLESDLLKTRLYQVIKIYEPNEFDNILNILHSGIMEGMPKQDMFAKTRGVSQKVLIKYLPYSSNKSLKSFLDLIIEQYEMLYKQDPVVCYNFMMGELEHFNPHKYFSNDLINIELNLIADIIESGFLQQNKIPTESEIEDIQSEVYALTLVESGEDFFLLEKENPSEVEKAKIGRVNINLFKQIKKLKESDRVRFLRFMFSY